LKDKADVMGNNLERQAVAMDALDKEINTTSDTLGSANAKLKNIITQFRSPAKFCMDIAMVIMLLILIGLIYGVVTGKVWLHFVIFR